MQKIDLGNGKSITMREPKVRDMLAVKDISNDVDREMALISNLTELSSDELSDLSWSKYQELQEAFKGFGYTKPKI